MKKIISLVLAGIMCLSFVACGGGDSKQGINKDELLSNAKPMTEEELSKSLGNVAFAKSLIGNTYTFRGEVCAITEDHAEVDIKAEAENGYYSVGADQVCANLYLSAEELVSLEAYQEVTFVGKLEDVTSHETSGLMGGSTPVPVFGSMNAVDLIFKNSAVVNDRFESTGTLDSKILGSNDNEWEVLFKTGNKVIVHFRDDVSSYEGKEITFSYKRINDKRVDAYIVK